MLTYLFDFDSIYRINTSSDTILQHDFKGKYRFIDLIRCKVKITFSVICYVYKIPWPPPFTPVILLFSMMCILCIVKNKIEQ